MRRLLFGALLLVVTACSNTQTAAQSPSTQSSGEVVAELGGRKVTLKELDEKWQALDPGEQARITQMLYQSRRNALDQLVGDLLIEEAAKAAGTSSQQYVQQETQKRAQPITDAEVQQFFGANKDRAQGRTLDELKGTIVEFLRSQREQQARAQLVDDLKKKRTDVKVLLDPPRVTVKIEPHDPTIGPATAPVTMVEFSDYQ
jgi:protein-disulfide isomerase